MKTGQKFVLTINKDYLIKQKWGSPQIDNVIEFDSHDEMLNFQAGMYYGIRITDDYKLWDLMDFEIVEEETDNER